MQPNSYKICPRCQTPAYLNASECAACGRQYRTQYIDQTQVVSPYAGVAPSAAPVRQLEQPLLLIGSALMILGVFCPLFSAPLEGGLSWIGISPTMGIGVIALACGALIATLFTQYTFARCVAGLYAIFLFVLLGRSLALFAVLDDKVTSSIQMQWGWVPLFLGCLLVLFTPQTSRNYESSSTKVLPWVFLVLSILAGVGGYENLISKDEAEKTEKRRIQEEEMEEVRNRRMMPPGMQNPHTGEFYPAPPLNSPQPPRFRQIPGYQRPPQPGFRRSDPNLGNFNS